MPYDLLIRNGTIVDGTGAPRQRADVAVAGGKIAALGKTTTSAKKIIDASDLIVAPGFIDPHTHYDAQICWDPLVTCSSWHGVTSTKPRLFQAPYVAGISESNGLSSSTRAEGRRLGYPESKPLRIPRRGTFRRSPPATHAFLTQYLTQRRAHDGRAVPT